MSLNDLDLKLKVVDGATIEFFLDDFNYIIGTYITIWQKISI